jgi:hypothetical protein
MSRPHARWLLAALPALTWVAGLAAAAGPAAAGTSTSTASPAYQFWGYYQLTDAAWAFAQTGPDGTAPEDGSVEGWRFAIADVSSPRLPRATVPFDDVCADTDASDGQKRVAVVLDYGRPADATDGAQPPAARAACAVVPQAASGADVLSAVAETRVEGGLVCGLDGYPAAGCGDAVTEVPPQAAAPDEPVELAGLPASGPTQGRPGTDAGAAAGAEDASRDDGQDDGAGAVPWVAVAVVLVAVIAVAALRRRRDVVED